MVFFHMPAHPLFHIISKYIAIAYITLLPTFALPDGNSNIPNSHVRYLMGLIDDVSYACGEIRPTISENELKNRLEYFPVHQSGTQATIYQKTYDCSGHGDIWSATGTVETLILVNDQAYLATVTAPPSTVEIDEVVYLWLDLDPSQCAFMDDWIIIDQRVGCVAPFIWDTELEVFYGHGKALSFVGYISE